MILGCRKETIKAKRKICRDYALWVNRARKVARYLPSEGKHVLDLGGGNGSLKRFIKYKSYTIMDNNRLEGTIYANFNSDKYPDAPNKDNLITAIGLLEYLDDVPAFLKKIQKYGKELYFTYYQSKIKGDAWVNHFRYPEILNMLKESGWQLKGLQPLVADEQALFNYEL